MGGSLLKNPNGISTRRQSLRLREINAIYESEDVALGLKLSQGTSEDSSSFVANQIKVETLSPDSPINSNDHFNDDTNTGYSENCGNKETSDGCDDQSIENMTLKDLQTRFKAKKRKVLKSVVSTEDDFKCVEGDFKMKIKEESDLEEPLISLKFKLSKSSSPGKKRRKCERHSSDVAQGSLFVDRASTVDGLSADTASDLLEPKISAGRNEVNCGITAKNFFVEIDDFPISSAAESKRNPLYSGSLDSDYNVKSEIIKSCSLDRQNTNTVAVSSTSEFIDKCKFPDNSSSETFKKVIEGESGNRESSCLTGKVSHLCTDGLMEMASHSSSSVSELERRLHENPELVYNTKSEVLETDCPVHERTIYIDASSNVNLIAKYDYCENSSSELLERVDGGEPENGESPSFSSTLLHCCVNELPSEYVEPDMFTYRPEIGGEHFETIRKNLSELLSHEVPSFPASEYKIAQSNAGSSVSVSAIMDHGSDVGSSTENHSASLEENIHHKKVNQDYLAINHNHENMEIDNASELNMANEDLRSLVDELPVRQMAICNHQNDEGIDHNLLCNEIHDVGDVSNSSMEVEHLDDFVQEAVAGDAGINRNDNHALPHMGEHSTVGTDYTCSTKHSNTCFSAVNVLHVKGSQPKVQKLLSSVEQMLNGDALTYHSAEVCNSIDAKGLEEAFHCHSLISSDSLNAINVLHHADKDLPKAAEKLSSSAADEKMYATAENPTHISMDISHSVDIEGQDSDKEKCEPGMKVEDPPRKILSNRKTFSPASQEMLRQALNGNSLYDAMKLSGYREAAETLGYERMIKKPKNNRSSSLPPVTKGILKSPESSCKTPCSCMKSSLIHMQTQEAIQFSQRQMHDIKSIAMKLLKGLDSMKNIVEETLCSEACSSAPSKFTTEEIRLATDHASELESTTNKWLSIMSRDCNRFCKIMRSTENKAASPANVVRKERKRITFADEAGGSLCHVKVFDQQPTPLVVPESDQDDL